MTRWGRTILMSFGLALAAGAPRALPAQQPAGGLAQEEKSFSHEEVDILHHIGNSHDIETPFGVWHLPRWEPVRIGSFSVDLSLTKHTVFMMIAALIVAAVFIGSGRSLQRRHRAGRAPKGFAGAMEAMALFIRQDVVLPNTGHGGGKYGPYLLTVFFFILAMNLFGVIPWGATATGNITVTAALALISFVVVEISGMVSLGPKGYLGTIFFLPHGLPGGVGGAVLKVVLLIVMTPIELIGKLAKPFALAVRLFANMTAGHVLVIALIGLTFLFKSYSVGVAASVMATGIMLLKVFVAFLQAYVFTLLTAVFIGLIREAH